MGHQLFVSHKTRSVKFGVTELSINPASLHSAPVRHFSALRDLIADLYRELRYVIRYELNARRERRRLTHG